jgi:hypothetical protein
MNNKSVLACLLSVLLSVATTHAQFSRRIFHSIGITPFLGSIGAPSKYGTATLDLFNRPSSSNYTPTYAYSVEYQRLYADRGPIVLGVTYDLRLNLIEMGYLNSISISTPFSAGFSIFNTSQRIGHVTAPVFADYNRGHNAVKHNGASRGFHVGVGYQWIVSGLMNGGPADNYANFGMQVWSVPMVRGGARFLLPNGRSAFIDVYFSRMYKQKTIAGVASTPYTVGSGGGGGGTGGGGTGGPYVKPGDQIMPPVPPDQGGYVDNYQAGNYRYENVWSQYYFKIVLGITLEGRKSRRNPVQNHLVPDFAFHSSSSTR